MKDWYQLNITQALQELGSDAERGLSDSEAARRLERYGPNELTEQGIKNPWLILAEQFKETMVIILIVAALLSALLGDMKDTVVIVAIVALNAILGFYQEYRAERAMAALKRLAVPTVKVRREGHVRAISALKLVPGDMVLLETGNLIPADGRLLEGANLRLEEAALTGESEPVEKEAKQVFNSEAPVGDRRNMVYMGTIVSYGHGLALITETGMQTELGQIANMLQTLSRKRTPLQSRLDQLGRVLALVAMAIVAVIFVLGLLRGEDIKLMFLTAVSMAVATVPEGLPAVVTIALALGAQRMLKRQALIRKLPAVETLGSVTVICSDKTGTLTQNRMTVTVLDVAGERIDLAQNKPRSNFVEDNRASLTAHPALSLLLAGGVLCNDAVLAVDENSPEDYQSLGDPTEGALVLIGARMGLYKSSLEQTFPRIGEIPFDSTRKCMTTIHHFQTENESILQNIFSAGPDHSLTKEESNFSFTKGAVDNLLDISTQIWVTDHPEPLSPVWRQRIITAHDQLADKGMRVLGVAYHPPEDILLEVVSTELERNLTFIGLVGMIDPPRPEVKAAVQTCRSAGIRPVMITGDHPLTARHIAEQLGIATDGRFLTGPELDNLTAPELDKAIEQVSVYARVSPEHKLNLIRAYQERGQVVAMTGDGVNDAPALKKADIGVAMGITGTDVSKEAAEMVLQDDNFATIVAAVEEGRIIYDNIRKFIKYLLSCNSGEVWVMLIAPFLGMPLPLLPLQILWMNLVTDGLPALALGLEPAERAVMRRPPHPPTESVFGRGMARDIIWAGLVMGAVSLGVGYGYWQAGRANWQTMVFMVLVFSQMMLALAARSERDSLFSIGIFSNKAMLGAVALTLVLQLAVIYIPFLQSLFKVVALSGQDLLFAFVISTVTFWFVEGVKWLTRRRT